MYAIIETGGKQYRVQEGDTIFIEKLLNEDGESITFENVLVVADGETVKFGAPTVEGATVAATVLKTGKSKKIIVFKFKAKKGYKKKQGHRQPYTKVQINKINA